MQRLKNVPRSAAGARVKKPSRRWLRPVVLALSALLLIAWFSREPGDSDTWWHLKTGQFILQQHRLPVPDPFAWTTYLGKPAYPGEEITRNFNLTHEWLAQIAMYGAYAAAGLPGLVLLRAAALALFCALAGAMVWLRTHGIFRALGATLAAAVVAHSFTADRPQYFTYLFLAVTISLLDSERWLWLLPAVFLVWANCHGGFILGWIAVGIYCAESLWRRRRLEWKLWTPGIAAILLSGINPNAFRVLEVMRNYRASALQSQILEWRQPNLLEVSPFTVLLYGALLILILNRRATRPVDWMLMIAFGAAGILAARNMIFTAWVSAVLIAIYIPALPLLAQPTAKFALGATMLAATGILIAQGQAFQFHVSPSTPVAAADFLEQRHLRGKLFNTWREGGYLTWRLWPQLQVFADGRALNESVAQDMQRIIFAADNTGEDTGGRNFEDLLNGYGADLIVMSSFEPISGAPYYLPAALADPRQTEWKLLYYDRNVVIYMRHRPAGVQPLDSLESLDAMEEQCSFLIERGAPACARGMADVFTRIGDQVRADRWTQTALESRPN